MPDTPTEPSPLEGAALTAHINDLNARVIRGESVSDSEIRSAVIALRSSRKFANATAPKTKKAKEKKITPITDLDALFASAPAKKTKPATPEKSSFDFDFLTEKK